MMNALKNKGAGTIEAENYLIDVINNNLSPDNEIIKLAEHIIDSAIGWGVIDIIRELELESDEVKKIVSMKSWFCYLIIYTNHFIKWLIIFYRNFSLFSMRISER